MSLCNPFSLYVAIPLVLPTATGPYKSKNRSVAILLLIPKLFFPFLKQLEGCLKESRLFSW